MGNESLKSLNEVNGQANWLIQNASKYFSWYMPRNRCQETDVSTGAELLKQINIIRGGYQSSPTFSEMVIETDLLHMKWLIKPIWVRAALKMVIQKIRNLIDEYNKYWMMNKQIKTINSKYTLNISRERGCREQCSWEWIKDAAKNLQKKFDWC